MFVVIFVPFFLLLSFSVFHFFQFLVFRVTLTDISL